MAAKIEEKPPARTAHASEIPQIVPRGFGDAIARRLEQALKNLPPSETIVRSGNGKGNGRKGAVIEAVTLGEADRVREFLDSGFDVNTKGKGGWSLLMDAAQNGDIRMVKLLVSRKALLDDVNDMGWTALMCAAVSGREDVAIFLLAQGADADIRDRLGNNAGKIAYENGYDGLSTIIRGYEKKP